MTIRVKRACDIRPGDILRSGLSALHVEINLARTDVPWWRPRFESEKPVKVTIAPHRMEQIDEIDGKPIYVRDYAGTVDLYYELHDVVVVDVGVPFALPAATR